MFSNSSMGCCPAQIDPPNEKANQLVSTLRIILYIELGLTILEFFALPISIGFMELISCLILYQGYTTLSFCHMVIYVFFIGINEIQFIVEFATYAQNEQPVPLGFSTIVLIFLIIFYTTAIYYAFQAYKEFKAIAFGSSSGFSMNRAYNYSGNNNNNNNASNSNAEMLVGSQRGNCGSNQQQQPQSQRQALSGRGVMIGGSSNATNPNPWRDREYEQA